MTLLELVDVTASYGPVQVLEGVSLSVPDGGATGILGANGAGKTTTLRAISGTVRAGGSIRFEGRDIRGLRADRVAALGIAHVPEGRGTLANLTVTTLWPPFPLPPRRTSPMNRAARFRSIPTTARPR